MMWEKGIFLAGVGIFVYLGSYSVLAITEFLVALL